MNEDEWRSSQNPKQMLFFVLGLSGRRLREGEAFPDSRLSDRKLRLFACACFHRVWPMIRDAFLQRAAAMAGRVAEGWNPAEDLTDMLQQVDNQLKPLDEKIRKYSQVEFEPMRALYEGLALARQVLLPQAPLAALHTSANALHSYQVLSGNPATLPAEAAIQAQILRCVAGFRPFRTESYGVLDPSQKALVDLANDVLRCGSEGRFFFDPKLLSELAGLVAQQGTLHPELVAHLREPGVPHARGCWAVDALLDLG